MSWRCRHPDDNRTRAFTLVELLLVIGVVALLVAVAFPAVSAARGRARETHCTTNLRSVGQAILSYAAGHDDETAPVVRERDYYWNRGEQRGWDIGVGRWLGAEGGGGSIWQCPQQRTAFVGNARALGLDNTAALPNGRVYRVGPRLWADVSRLVLAYDLQYNLLDNLYAHARDESAGDLSDEMHAGWPRERRQHVVVPLLLDRWGPHRERYGVLFADGHAAAGRYSSAVDAVWWSGRPWWLGPRKPSGGGRIGV